MSTRRCRRCGRRFTPDRGNSQYYCEPCYHSKATIGFSDSKQRSGRPSRVYNRIWRVKDNRRSKVNIKRKCKRCDKEFIAIGKNHLWCYKCFNEMANISSRYLKGVNPKTLNESAISIKQPVKASIADKPIKQRSLGGFYLLLQYIYGRRIQLVEILSALGIPQNRVTIWCQDDTWLLNFIERLENALLDVLIDSDINNNPSILLEYYLADCSVERLVIKYKLTNAEVLRVINGYRLYLRSDKGRNAFEQIVLRCLEE